MSYFSKDDSIFESLDSNFYIDLLDALERIAKALETLAGIDEN